MCPCDNFWQMCKLVFNIVLPAISVRLVGMTVFWLTLVSRLCFVVIQGVMKVTKQWIICRLNFPDREKRILRHISRPTWNLIPCWGENNTFIEHLLKVLALFILTVFTFSAYFFYLGEDYATNFVISSYASHRKMWLHSRSRNAM